MTTERTRATAALLESWIEMTSDGNSEWSGGRLSRRVSAGSEGRESGLDGRQERQRVAHADSGHGSGGRAARVEGDGVRSERGRRGRQSAGTLPSLHAVVRGVLDWRV